MADNKIHYPGFDVLRALAIMLVVLYHYFYFFRIGWMGVDLFFVISGFLITGILLRSRREKNYFRNFYIKRILRIFPIYFLVILTFYSAAPIFSEKGNGSVYDYYLTNQVWFYTFTQNWLFQIKGLPPEPYLQHFWSLGIEEQFYLLWPLVIYLFKDVEKLKTFLICLFVLAIISRLFFLWGNHGFEGFYYNTFSRLDSLTAGSFLAVLTFQEKLVPTLLIVGSIVAFVLTIFLSVFYFDNVDHNSLTFATVGYSIIAVFFMCLCSMALRLNFSIGNNAAVKFIAKTSYGIYVYHLPVLLVISSLINKWGLLQHLGKHYLLVLSVSCLIITLFIAFISYHFIERPVLGLKKYFSTKDEFIEV